jgi:hypothetical protein
MGVSTEMKNLLIAGVAVAAAITLSPMAVADPGDQAKLGKPFSEVGAPFVGTWQAHEESLIVSADGTGAETYPDRSSCPDAPMAGCGQTATVNFRLSEVQGPPPIGLQPDTTAYGNIVSGGNAERGSYVTITLADGGKGVVLWVANGDQGFPFCKMVNGNKVNSADCGA